MNMAGIELAKGNEDAAVKLLQRVISLDPGNAKAQQALIYLEK